MTCAELPDNKVCKKNLELLDQLIGSNKYLAGNDLTLADLSVLATLSYTDIAKYDLSDYKNVERWRSHLEKEVKNYNENVFAEDEQQSEILKLKAKMNKNGIK